MYLIRANYPNQPVQFSWKLPRSKSLWARHLLLDAMESKKLNILQEEATPIDIRALAQALQAFEAGELCLDVCESGTAMRLLLAFLVAQTDRPIHLRGQGRQHQRPIAPLVSALRQLGARIDYLGEEGFPPLAIYPSELNGEYVELDTSSSSQYLSALFLLAPILSPGVRIDTSRHTLASRPYAEMTRQFLAYRGYLWEEESTGIFIYRGKQQALAGSREIEADWSAASYAYALLALLPVGSSCTLSGLHLPSLQGDAEALCQIFTTLGVTTTEGSSGVCLTKQTGKATPFFRFSMQSCPDLVPAVVVALVGRGIPFRLEGVAHLRIKESDRLLALKEELAKLGYDLLIEDDALSWDGKRGSYIKGTLLSAHGDHRIAMALALLALQEGSLQLDSPDVVSKSFPGYWEVLAHTGLFI